MEEAQQITFEKLVRWCGKMYTGLPLTFLLGNACNENWLRTCMSEDSPTV